jgi:hypothetical protein
MTTHVIETASSGRAKCRACGQMIAKGQLRLGERAPNPYGEGEATFWFHPVCGAAKRPEVYLAAIEATPDVGEIPDGAGLRALAERGVAKPRLVRLAQTQRAPSGRARCRHCRETIDKGLWRFGLDIWEDGRFGAIGFIHAACAPGYFEDTADLATRAKHLTPTLTDDDLRELLPPASPTTAP